MKSLEERIIKDGVVRDGNVLKVDSFLNHQMDIALFNDNVRLGDNGYWWPFNGSKPFRKF